MSYTNNLITPIANADFTSVGSSLTLLDTVNGVNMVKPNAAANSIAGLYISTPGTPYTVTVCLCFNSMGIEVQAGVGWSDGTKYATFYVCGDGAGATEAIASAKYTNSTTLSTTYSRVQTFLALLTPIWLQISDDGVNRICRRSTDGINFWQFHSIARTDFLTPTRVGMFINPLSAAANITYLSWKVT